MSPKQRRAFLAHRWDTRLKGKTLKRLRTRLLEHWSCDGVLSRRQRRAVILRAGLFGHTPATWRRIARRLRVSLPRAVRVTRFGARRLTRAGTCIEAGGAALGTSVYTPGGGRELLSDGATATSDGATPTSRDEPDVGDVGGVSQSSPELGPGLFGGGGNGAGDVVLVFLALMLTVLAGLAWQWHSAVRRS
jgi:hypothetical protein